jgi:hypothetical protein
MFDANETDSILWRFLRGIANCGDLDDIERFRLSATYDAFCKDLASSVDCGICVKIGTRVHRFGDVSTMFEDLARHLLMVHPELDVVQDAYANIVRWCAADSLCSDFTRLTTTRDPPWTTTNS